MRRVVPTLCIIALLVTACSSDSSSKAPETTAAASTESSVDNTAFCAALDDLRTSTKALAGFDVIGQGTDALKAAFAEIKAKVALVKAAAPGDVKAKVEAVGTAFETLQTDVDAAATAVDKGKAMVSGVLAVQTALTDLGEAAKNAKCA
jgi:hypothetical protein